MKGSWQEGRWTNKYRKPADATLPILCGRRSVVAAWRPGALAAAANRPNGALKGSAQESFGNNSAQFRKNFLTHRAT